MARTNKIGIYYFPFDVDFFDDDKIKLIESEFGMKGGYVAVRLLCKIYKEGYYYKWGTDECLLFSKSLGVEGVSKGLLDEIISGLIRRCFLDKECFDKFGILTSKGIQERYFEATKRYKQVNVIREYILVDNIKANNVNIYSINDNINPQKKGKENKKEKLSKESKKKNPPSPFEPENFKDFSMISLNDCKQELLSDEYWKETVCINIRSSGFSDFTPKTFDSYISSFFMKLENEGENSKSVKDAKSHFARWLKIELKNEKDAENRRNSNTRERADNSAERKQFIINKVANAIKSEGANDT